VLAKNAIAGKYITQLKKKESNLKEKSYGIGEVKACWYCEKNSLVLDQGYMPHIYMPKCIFTERSTTQGKREKGGTSVIDYTTTVYQENTQ